MYHFLIVLGLFWFVGHPGQPGQLPSPDQVETRKHLTTTTEKPLSSRRHRLLGHLDLDSCLCCVLQWYVVVREDPEFDAVSFVLRGVPRGMLE